MNSKLLAAFLAMFALSGCVVVAGGGGGHTTPPATQPGDVTFTWTFEGHGCADYPNIKNVVVTIPGQTLQNDGVYACQTNNYPGIILRNFAGGSYDFTLQALDYNGDPLFTGGGTFTVNGDVSVTVDLKAQNGALTSYAYLTWSFPPLQGYPNPTCAQAGVSYVYVDIDGSPVDKVNCEAGTGGQMYTTPYLQPGQHTLTLTAVDTNDFAYYALSTNFTTSSGAPSALDYSLQWAVGGASVGWQITNGSTQMSCSQAGVTTVYVNFGDGAGNNLYPGAGDPQDCTVAPVVYSYLPPGNYYLYLQGVDGSGQVLYRSNPNNPPVITVAAGTFPTEQQATIATMANY